jgi:hypothetical protein
VSPPQARAMNGDRATTSAEREALVDMFVPPSIPGFGLVARLA